MDSVCKYGSQKTVASDLYSLEPRKSTVHALPEAAELLFLVFLEGLSIWEPDGL